MTSGEDSSCKLQRCGQCQDAKELEARLKCLKDWQHKMLGYVDELDAGIKVARTARDTALDMCEKREVEIKKLKAYSVKLEKAVLAGARLYAGANRGFGMTADDALSAIMALADTVVDPEKKDGA